jgi:hypothetical protein
MRLSNADRAALAVVMIFALLLAAVVGKVYSVI